MKIFISTLALLVVSLASTSCSSHSSCPAYTDSNEKGMKFEKTNTQEIVELETKNV